ncbi:MAG TPA: ATP-binding protein [Gallionella sp.]|nr:ATP-binding protein [Gallionella sp.]
MKRFGISTQITALTLIPLLVVVISMEAFFLRARFADIDADLLGHGKLMAHQLAGSAEYGVFSNNLAFLASISENALLQREVRSITIMDGNDKVLFSSRGARHRDLDNKAEGNSTEQNISPAQIGLLNPVKTDAKSVWIYQPIVPTQVNLDDMEGMHSAQQIGAVIVEMSRADSDHRKSEMLWFNIAVTALILAFPLYAIFLASRSITHPIRRLSNAVLKIAQGHLETRVDASRNQTIELASLSSGINEMAAQLQAERAILEQRIEEATLALREKKEEAERASHDKSHFLAVASHDLRQPLHALGLYIAELKRNSTGDEQQHLIKQIERSAESLSTLLNALLDISKLDAGAIVPQIQSCDLNFMLSQVAADYQMLSQIRNIRLVVRACPIHVSSDPMLLERILMNLVSNALRYTPQNGCVMIACRHRNNHLRIEVRDNGIGITASDQANIFREFFQIAQPQLDSSKGLGLGLAIVDRLAKLLGHKIELRSAPAKGTVFAVEVPIAATLAGEASFISSGRDLEPEGLIEHSPLTGKRLLVVDDDDMVLNSTASILTSWGCKVTLATSLPEVERHLQDGMHWDMIISDYQLENHTTGIDVIDQVRRHLAKELPCILISGDTGPAVLKLAAVGGYHLLHKPVKPAKLRSLVLHLLDEEK